MRPTSKAIALIAAALVVGTAVPAAAETVPGLPVYLALGDSWAYGQGATIEETDGYAGQLSVSLTEHLDCLPAQSDMAADGCKHLQFVNLARPARDGLPGVRTLAVRAEQFPVARQLLARNHDANPRNDVEVITLHVGGNDVSGPIIQACVFGSEEACIDTFNTVLPQYAADLYGVVGELRQMAGPDAQIVLGTYDNPLPYCPLGQIPGAEALGNLALEGTPDGSVLGLNDIVRAVAAAHDAEVAEVFGTMGQGDWIGDCLHLTDSGHDVVEAAFLAAIDD